MVGMAASTLKALTALGAGALFPASSLAVSFKIWIVISPLPVKLDRVTVRVTVPLVPVPETSKIALAVPVFFNVTCELSRVTAVTPL